MPPDDRPAASAPAAPPVAEPESNALPIEIPEDLKRYLIPGLDEQAYKHFPLKTHHRVVLTRLSRARVAPVLTVILGTVAGAAWGLFSNEEPITPDNLAQALVPKPLRDWWLANPTQVLLAALPVAVVLVAVFIWGEIAHKSLNREKRVLELREKLAVERRHQRTVEESRNVAQQAAREEVQRHAGWGELPSAEPQGPPFEEAALDPPRRFVGHTDDLAWLLDRLRAPYTPGVPGTVTVVQGQPGIGKTALAAEALRRVRAEGCFPDGVGVLRADDQTDALTVLRTILTRFDVYRRATNAGDAAGLATAAHRLLDGKNALIVIDNVEPTLDIAAVVAPLRATSIRLLLTTREALPIAAESRRLEPMVEPDAVDLFAEYYGRNAVADLTPSERAVVERIVEDLGRHTLAVKLAAAYARDLNADLEQLARDLADPRQAVSFPFDPANTGAPDGLRVSFARSYGALPAGAQRLFAALGALATPEFGRGAVVALARDLGLAQPDASADLLVQRSLLDAALNARMPEGSDRQRRRLHPLLRGYAQTLFAAWPDDERAPANRAIATSYAEYAIATDDLALAPDEANIIGALEWAHMHGEDELVADLCSGMGYFWRDTGRTNAALAYLPWGVEAAERIAKATKARDDQLRASRLSLIYGDILYAVGRLPEAEAVYKPNLIILRELEDRQGEGVVLSSLGQIAKQRGRLEEAEQYFLQSLAIAREAQNRQGEGVVLSSLGDIAQQRGRLEEAEEHFQQALVIAREVQDRRGEGANLTSLGQIAQQRGRLEEAEQYFLQSLAIEREVQGRRGEGTVLAWLGQIAHDRGRLEEAEEHFQQALVIDREVQDRRGEGADLTSLGRIAQQRGRLEEAEEHFQQALVIAREVQNRRGEGTDLTSLGDIAQQRGRLEEAEQYYLQSLAIDREVQDRRGEGADLTSLGRIAQQRGRLEEAKQYYLQSLAIAREVQDRRGEGVVLSSLGHIAQQRGRLEEAEQYYLQSLAIDREVQDRRGEGVDLYRLALVAEARGDLDRAEALHRESLAIGIAVHNGQDIADSYAYLGQFLITKRSKREEGCQMLAEAARLYDEMGSPGAEEARVTARRLGCL
jgi:tetratricopeptide (TPR) repeat protein